MKIDRLALSAMLFCCLSVIASAQIDNEIVSVDSSIVVMNAAITDARGNAVEGLKQSDFRIFEDGIEQTVAAFSAEETPFAAVILLDTSGSMEQRVSLARSAAINFLDGLRISDSAAIFKFDSKVQLIQEFSNRRDIGEAVFDLKAYGMTVLNDAVVEAAESLAQRPEKRRAIIVLSDGADTQSRKSDSYALKAVLAANAVLYTVDMSSIETGGRQRMQSQGILRRFAEKTGGVFVSTPGGVAMRKAFKAIVEELGMQYTITFQPVDSRKVGKWRELELRVARPGLTIRTRKGYHAAKSR
ncbi:MAG: VWA domain-containing protein [Pyrinomonadaceae bacterium]